MRYDDNNPDLPAAVFLAAKWRGKKYGCILSGKRHQQHNSRHQHGAEHTATILQRQGARHDAWVALARPWRTPHLVFLTRYVRRSDKAQASCILGKYSKTFVFILFYAQFALSNDFVELGFISVKKTKTFVFILFYAQFALSNDFVELGFISVKKTKTFVFILFYAQFALTSQTL